MTKILTMLAGPLCAGLLTLHAADKAHLEGPKGGRFLEKTEPRAEFLVEKDRGISIHFYDAASKILPATDQIVTVVAEAKSGKEKIDFEKKNGSLVGKTKLPAGDDYNVVVQFKQTPTAKPLNFRFKLDLHICESCKRAEYSCTCHE